MSSWYQMSFLLSIYTLIKLNVRPCWYLERVLSHVNPPLCYLRVLSWSRFPTTNILESPLHQTCPGPLTSVISAIRQEDLLGCCIGTFTGILTLLKLYLSYVRPHLEYYSHVWTPSLKGNVDIIEAVQKYALHVCTKSWELSYDDVLSATSISPFHQRWIIACLCHLYKILNGLTEFPDTPVQPKIFPMLADWLTHLSMCTQVPYLLSRALLLSKDHNYME